MYIFIESVWVQNIPNTIMYPSTEYLFLKIFKKIYNDAEIIQVFYSSSIYSIKTFSVTYLKNNL